MTCRKLNVGMEHWESAISNQQPAIGNRQSPDEASVLHVLYQYIYLAEVESFHPLGGGGSSLFALVFCYTFGAF